MSDAPGPPPDADSPDDGDEAAPDPTVHRLRLRAEALRAGPEADAPSAADEVEATDETDSGETDEVADADLADAEDDTGTEDDTGDEDGTGDEDPWRHIPPGPDPAAAGRLDLLTQWADEEQLETAAPRFNWSRLLAPLVLLAVIAAAVFAGWWLIDRASDEDDGPAGPRGEDAEAASVLAEDPPSLEDLTADITVPPGPDIGLQVVEQGVTIVEDRFDESRREGTFAVVLENPNDDQVAQNVQIDVAFLDADGTPVATDTAFVQLVLPGQRVAVAALVFNAPTVPVAGLDVAVDVARWREVGPAEGAFEILTFETVEAEFSGVRTTFELRSTFPDLLEDVGVTVVYRRADGSIIGGADTFLELVEPGIPTPGEVVLLANIDIDDVASTELFPTPSLLPATPDGG